MNNNNTDSLESSKKVANGKVYPDRSYSAGLVTPPSNRETQPKEKPNHEPSSERSKQGSKGISSDGKRKIGIALYLMAKKYDYKLLFLVIKFNNVERNTKRKFARNPDKVINCIKYLLDKLGVSYVLNTGIQKDFSHGAKMPLFDINIVLPIEGVDIDKLLSDIALKLRDIANDSKITESIGTWYCKPITNDSSNFDKFKNYIIEQSAYNSIFKTITDEWGYKLPKTWHRIDKELDKQCEGTPFSYNGTLYELAIQVEAMGDEIKEVNSRRLIAKDNNTDNFDKDKKAQQIEKLSSNKGFKH